MQFQFCRSINPLEHHLVQRLPEKSAPDKSARQNRPKYTVKSAPIMGFGFLPPTLSLSLQLNNYFIDNLIIKSF